MKQTIVLLIFGGALAILLSSYATGAAANGQGNLTGATGGSGCSCHNSTSSIGPATPHWLIGGIVVVFGVIRATQFIASNMLSYADTPDGRLSQATSLFGAVGSWHGPLLGAFILATINNGANLLNVNSFWQRIITGGLIIVIVYFDSLRRHKR